MNTMNVSDLTSDLVKDIVTQHGGYSNAANWLLNNFVIMSDIFNHPITFNRLRVILSDVYKIKQITERNDTSRVSRIEKLLDNANVPLEAIGSINNVKLGIWGIHAKDKDGNIQTSYLDKTQITLIPEAPTFPIVNCAEPREIKFNIPEFRLLRQTYQAIVVSDTQIGFLQDPETKAIEPIHDPEAMRIAKHVCADISPRELYFIGDWMDWPFLSRFTQHDEYDAVNESIQEGYDQLCEFISASGPQLTKKVMIGGNHDIRPEKFLLEHNRKAMRVKRAGDKWPVFSQQFLLRYDELGIQTPGYYPGGEYYVLPDLVLTHAPPKAHEFQASVIHGHLHRVERHSRVQHGVVARHTYFTYDIGCLCQTGTSSNPYRLMGTRVPSDRPRTDWSQGIAVINIVDGEVPIHSVDQISIVNHKAIYQGKLYE